MQIQKSVPHRSAPKSTEIRSYRATIAQQNRLADTRRSAKNRRVSTTIRYLECWFFRVQDGKTKQGKIRRFVMRIARCGGTVCSSRVRCCRMIPLAKKLGSPAHHSLLLRKAEGLGLHGAPELIGLAIVRGCQHYQGGPEPVPSALPPRAAFSDEELAIALLSACLLYSPRAVRVGAQMLGNRGNQPRRLALLARRERAENVVRHIAAAGWQTEP